MTEELIDRIYECSVVPELWPDVLDDLAKLADARGGLLFSARRALEWTASDGVRDVFSAYVNDGWFARCSRRVCLMSQIQPSFFVEHDFWTDEELDDNPIYRDFFRPHGLGWSAGTALQMGTGDNIVFSVERAFDGGPIGRESIARLNEVRPHLARSAFVTARLGLQRAKGATETLTALGLPALLVDDQGAVIEASPAIEGLSHHVRWNARNQVAFVDPQANNQLRASLTALGAPSADPVGSFGLRDTDGKAALIAHVVPIRRTAHDIFANSYALLVLTPLGGKRAPSAEVMRSLFDLTTAEARVAHGLVAGRTLEEIAVSGEVAITTVRSQLRRILEKTGCTRQAELVILLASVTLGESGGDRRQS